MSSELEQMYHEGITGCSCFRCAPCSWCTSMTEEELEAYDAGGIDGLIALWALKEEATDTEANSRAELKRLCANHWKACVSPADLTFGLDEDGDISYEGRLSSLDGYWMTCAEAAYLLSQAGYVVLPKELFEDA